MQPDPLVPTRRSLISRLRNWDDQESWREFFTTYWKLIYSVAIKSGLSDQEAEDVVQETVLSVAKKMDTFKYDPAVCSFKGWLMHVTRLRIIDQLRKRQRGIQPKNARQTQTSRTATVERIADPASLKLDSIWDEEWQKNLIDAAMDRVKRRVNPEHYQIFYMNTVKKVAVRKVAEMFSTNVPQVYLIKHRVAALIKKEVRSLQASESATLKEMNVRR